MIHPMHMQIDRNLNKNAAGIFTFASCVCGLQKVGFGTAAFALHPLDGPDVLEDSNQKPTLIYLRLSLLLGINSNL